MRTLAEGLVVLALLALVIGAPFCDVRANPLVPPETQPLPDDRQPGWCPTVVWVPCVPARTKRELDASLGCEVPGRAGLAGIVGDFDGDISLHVFGRTGRALTLHGDPVCE